MGTDRAQAREKGRWGTPRKNWWPTVPGLYGVQCVSGRVDVLEFNADGDGRAISLGYDGTYGRGEGLFAYIWDRPLVLPDPVEVSQ